MNACLALGSSSAMSSSPPTVRGSPPNTGGRMLFSNVARLGYAAAHDSPSLRTEETSSLPKVANDSSGANGVLSSFPFFWLLSLLYILSSMLYSWKLLMITHESTFWSAFTLITWALIPLLVGSRNAGTPSFANVISTAKFGENTDAPKTNEVGKKGKKQNRVLLSTSGGRRY